MGHLRNHRVEENGGTVWKLFRQQSGKGFPIMTSGILDAFLDGSTGAGLYERARLPGPPTTYPQAMIALTCGFAASVGVMVGFTYLVVHDYPKTAYVLISALVAGGIVRIVRTVRPSSRPKVAPEIDPVGPADIQ